MFEQAFTWLDSPSTCPLTHFNQPATLTTCLTTKNVVSQQVQEARRDYRADKYCQPQDQNKITTSHLKLQRTERYLKFIETCEKSLQIENEQSIYLLLLNIMQPNEKNASNVHTVLAEWLNHEPTLALQFYEKQFNSSMQAAEGELQNDSILISMGTVCVRYYLDNLKITLQYQLDPLGLCQVSLAFLDNPLRFTSCIIWIIEQGGSIANLLQSGILHKYINYYFPSFGVFDRPLNAVSLLYKIVEQFENAKPLIDYAQRVSCDVRGYTRFNLLGQRSNSLLTLDYGSPSQRLTRTPDNLRQILEVFGEHGLIQSVSELFHCSEDEFDLFLVKFVQGSNHLLTPSLIKQTAEDRPLELYKWAYFVDDSLFQQWIAEKKFSILYLLPYKPQWVSSIDNAIMQSFLDLINTPATPGSEMEKAKLLLSLYEATRSINTSLSEPIYHAFFHFVLMHRYLLDDQRVFVALRQSKYLNDLVENEAGLLKNSLAKAINTFLDGGMNPDEYNELTEYWQILSGKNETLTLIKKVHCDFPATRGNYIVYIFELLSLKPVQQWNTLLEITQLISPEAPKISDYSYELFLKLLSRVDQDELREIIFSVLNITSDFFINKGRSVLLNGITAGNVGLLNYYLTHNALDDELAQQAIISKQWPMINGWFNHYGFSENSQELIEFLLVEVAGSKKINLLRALIKESDLHFRSTSVAKAFAKAASVDDPIALNYLYLLKPWPMTMKAVFSQAIKDEHFKSLGFFKRLKKHHAHLADAILTAFNSAVRNNNVKMVSYLMEFSVNAPSQAHLKIAKRCVEERGMKKLKPKKGTKETETLNSAESVKMVQLLNQLLTERSSSNQTKERVSKPKLPIAQSFFSTDSLTRQESTVFASPGKPDCLAVSQWN
jgi:hypothetical protein